ncbi:MAG: hypothetical protein INF97_07920 [Roseomonas sp.]|nr:hypothetical protein [Roseomonas sp.]
MYSEITSPLLGQVLLVAVLAIFALGMAFWLLLAVKIARAVTRKRSTLEGALLASATRNTEAARKVKVHAS